MPQAVIPVIAIDGPAATIAAAGEADRETAVDDARQRRDAAGATR